MQGGDNTGTRNAGLPNLNGYFYADNTIASHVSGVFRFENKGYRNLSYGDGYSAGLCYFDAARNNPIFGDSDTVQPPALSLMPQIKFQGGDSTGVVAAGLPNITGDVTADRVAYNNSNGALTFGNYGVINDADYSKNGNRTIYFNASASNPIYGNSKTVQPPALQLIPQTKY